MQMRAVAAEPVSETPYDLPDASGHFGPYGGTFVAETLQAALEAIDALRAEVGPEAQADVQLMTDFLRRADRGIVR